MKNEEINNLEHTLITCITACESCMSECLQERDVAQMVKCINLQRDCIDICVATARFLARDSAHTMHIMKECAEICKLCAEECSKHNNWHCQKCAEKCRECHQACESYLHVHH